MAFKNTVSATIMVSEEGDLRVPPSAVESLGLDASARLALFRYKGRIELVPIPTVDEMKGFLPDISTDIEREREDRV